MLHIVSHTDYLLGGSTVVFTTDIIIPSEVLDTVYPYVYTIACFENPPEGRPTSHGNGTLYWHTANALAQSEKNG